MPTQTPINKPLPTNIQWNMQPMDNCQSSYDSFAGAAGCSVDDIQCLQALSVDEVHTAFTNAIPTIDVEAFVFGPTVDGVEATQVRIYAYTPIHVFTHT